MIDALPPAEQKAILSLGRHERMLQGDTFFDAGGPIERVGFPTKGVVSLVATMHDGDGIEVHTVGREGFIGLGAFLGTPVSINAQAVCQIAGGILTIGSEVFKQAVVNTPTLRSILERYAHTSLTTTAQVAACNRLHPINERCARSLAMTRERIDNDQVDLTQEFLAQMLGVRRPSVTLAANTLQAAGLISYRRGRIQILDFPGLEDASCECLAVIRQAHELVFSAGAVVSEFRSHDGRGSVA